MGLFDNSGPNLSDYTPMTFDAENAARRAADVNRPSGTSMPDDNTKTPEQQRIDQLEAEAEENAKALLKSPTGFKKRELEIKSEEIKAQLANAKTAAAASRYGADRSLEGTKYSSDNSLEGTKYSSDNSLKGTQYSSDSSAATSRYGTDADLYKFQANQPLERADRANTFLKTYTDLSSRPDSFLQASNYARLGQQIEGMPLMLSDLLGQVNPNGQPVNSGNIAFRSGGAVMPQNAGVATFGTNPLNLGTRGPDPTLPVYQGPQGQYVYGGQPTYQGPQGTFAASFAPVNSYGATYSNPNAAAYNQTYGAQGGSPVPMAINDVTSQGTPANSQTPRVLQNGQIVAASDPNEEAFKLGVRNLMQNGAHTWGNQSLERMTQTERDLLASGIKDAGGVPADYQEAYARSRIGNDSSGRAL